MNVLYVFYLHLDYELSFGAHVVLRLGSDRISGTSWALQELKGKLTP
jgi:hypothetical protein